MQIRARLLFKIPALLEMLRQKHRIVQKNIGHPVVLPVRHDRL